MIDNLNNIFNPLKLRARYGVRWNKGNNTLEIQLGSGNWQPITDPDSIVIQNFNANVVTQEISLDDLCGPAGVATCLKQCQRRVDFTITAAAKSDPNVRRTLTVSEKIRADEITATCSV